MPRYAALLQVGLGLLILHSEQRHRPHTGVLPSAAAPRDPPRWTTAKVGAPTVPCTPAGTPGRFGCPAPAPPRPRRQTARTSWRRPRPRQPGGGYLGLSRRISAADAAILEAPTPGRRLSAARSPTNGGHGGRKAGRPKPRSGPDAAAPSWGPAGTSGYPQRPPRYSNRSELGLYAY